MGTPEDEGRGAGERQEALDLEVNFNLRVPASNGSMRS
jgi:hypothetical protein